LIEPVLQAVVADYVFDGSAVHERAAVIMRGTRIVQVVPRAEVPRTMSVHVLPEGACLAPGFIDLQVNGGGDVLFNDEPTLDGVCAIAAAHRKFGTTALLPTLITDRDEKVKLALQTANAVVEQCPAILGIHLEGPYLSPEKAGVHDARYMRRPTADDISMLTAPRNGVLLMTLAPEIVPAGFIRTLVEAGVRVSLGHSMASYRETGTAMVEGLRGFTHLFNAMRPLSSREPGPIAQALESTDAGYGLIADGVHVDPAMLRLALRGLGRPVLITDAMPPVGGSGSSFSLYGNNITVRNGSCVTDDGILAGTVLNMATAVKNCIRLLGIPLSDALRLASANPATVMGLEHVLGKFACGYRADIVAFDPHDVTVLATWVAGTCYH